MRNYWILSLLSLLLIHSTGQAHSDSTAHWEQVTLHKASDAPAFPDAIPQLEPRLSITDSRYSIHQLHLGQSLSQARSILQSTFPGIKALASRGLEQRWQYQNQPAGHQLRTSYRLITSKDAPEHISELQVNWFSTTLPSALLHKKLIQLMSKQSGPAMSWKQAQSAYVSSVQRAYKWADARLQQTTAQAKQHPTLRVLLKHQQHQVFQLSRQLAQSKSSTRLPASQLCNALSIEAGKYCHLRGSTQPNANNKLISNLGNCHYWLQNNGEMMSACAIIGGTQLRITSPAVDRHQQQQNRRRQHHQLKL